MKLEVLDIEREGDVGMKPAGMWAGALLVSLAIIMGVVYAMVRILSTAPFDPNAPEVATSFSERQAPPITPRPRLQSSEYADFKTFKRSQDAWLNGYGWVDRQKGIVHVPIERAMDLWVARRPGSVERPTEERPEPPRPARSQRSKKGRR